MFSTIAYFNLLSDLLFLLSSSINIKDIKGDNYIFYAPKYRIDYYNNYPYNKIRIVENNKDIACLDYIINKDNIIIEYFSIENEEFHKDFFRELHTTNITNIMKEQIKKALLQHIYKVAKNINIYLIVLDIQYNRELSQEGFITKNTYIYKEL